MLLFVRSAHIIEVLLYVGSSLGFEQSFSICALFSPLVHIHCSWSGESVVSRRKLPADVGKVLEGEGGTVRSGWRLLGQAADDCFLTAMRENCRRTDHNPLVKEMFSLYLGPPHLFLRSFILPYFRMTAGRHTDAVWISPWMSSGLDPGAFNGLTPSKVSRYISFSSLLQLTAVLLCFFW